MRIKGLGIAGILAGALVTIVSFTAPSRADASIHEIIAALCRAGGEEVVPYGQNKDGNSFVRALQASGFLTSIEVTATAVTLHFDPTVPNSKFMSAGFDLTIPDAIAPGVDLVLSPLVVPDPSFPAHANCHNLN
jgi:hypothetical protein